MVYFLGLILGILSATAVAKPSFGPFPGIVDHQTFTQLSRQDQRDFARSLMWAVVDFEEAHKRISTAPESAKKRTTLLRLEEFQRSLTALLTIQDAWAGADDALCPDLRVQTRNVQQLGTCVFGGWQSTFVQNPNTGNNRYCQRPACSIDTTLRAQFANEQRGCSRGTSACNPTIFGRNGQAPLCVNLTGVGAHNVSLACTLKFEEADEATRNARLDALIQGLSNQSSMRAFNTVVATILNTCVCGGGGNSEVSLSLHEDYIAYMQDHRTCYSLIAQMRHLVSRLKNSPTGVACNPILNQSVLDGLSQDLEVIGTYTERVRGLQELLGLPSPEAVLTRYRERFATDAQSLQQAVRRPRPGERNSVIENTNLTLDVVAPLDNHFRSVASKTSEQGGWCPITLPSPIILTDTAGVNRAVAGAQTTPGPQTQPVAETEPAAGDADNTDGDGEPDVAEDPGCHVTRVVNGDTIQFTVVHTDGATPESYVWEHDGATADPGSTTGTITVKLDAGTDASEVEAQATHTFESNSVACLEVTSPTPPAPGDEAAETATTEPTACTIAAVSGDAGAEGKVYVTLTITPPTGTERIKNVVWAEPLSSLNSQSGVNPGLTAGPVEVPVGQQTFKATIHLEDDEDKEPIECTGSASVAPKAPVIPQGGAQAPPGGAVLPASDSMLQGMY